MTRTGLRATLATALRVSATPVATGTRLDKAAPSTATPGTVGWSLS